MSGKEGYIGSFLPFRVQQGAYMKSVALVCEKDYVRCFLRVPLTVGLYCQCGAEQASKENFNKHYLAKHFTEPDALNCT